MSSSKPGSMHSPVFLIGTQRSGTTLLCRMLSAHPDIFIKNEVSVRSVFTPGASPEAIREGISHSVKLATGKSLDELMAAENKTIWGLKDPELTTYLADLKQFLPQARFIIIFRDARAVVNSYMENKWGLGTNAYTGAQRWKREVEAQMRFHETLPNHVLKLRFEDLVLNQQQTLETVCDFLGVPFDKSMLDYSKQKGFIKTTRENKKAFEAPDSAMTRKWENKLSGHQIRVVDSVCAPILDSLGYDVAPTNYSVPSWLVSYYRLHQKVIGEIQIQYRWRLSAYRQRYRKWLAQRIESK
ncbi:Sulfotransferase family protein [Marinobacter daqiaonensis]|uniref:Sulfotransferase family protein n=1 Tax=Marinobacter daqiaonensis TaxID=650891 RepID=A0A1I6HWI4_9GAMM|nr:sulfotransferase [Marinobacter daqiaonensis]SFR58826.1 Sulfotransferase family protein [Marinobacter daqiaonensis]